MAKRANTSEGSSPFPNKSQKLFSVKEKIDAAAPYRFFLTKVNGNDDGNYDDKLDISFSDLLDSSLGDLEDSVHFTFTLDISWLEKQFAGHKKPFVFCDKAMLKNPQKTLPEWVCAIDMNPGKNEKEFGKHHTKMSLLFYKGGHARIAIYTANLGPSGWGEQTEGVWVSPELSVMEGTAGGDSPTNFKTDLMEYLMEYKEYCSISLFKPWFKKLEKLDMSEVLVWFVASVPGNHSDGKYGFRKLENLLTEHVVPKLDSDWEIICQCSSFGKLGDGPEWWLQRSFQAALAPNCKEAKLSVIYPSKANVEKSSNGLQGGGCLLYKRKLDQEDQPWLRDFFHEWNSDARKRSAAVPHIKTYTRISQNEKLAAWFLLTSANLSIAAWGCPKGNVINIQSYEVGVLFLPNFLIGKEAPGLPIEGNNRFPLPYDIPLTKYALDDEPYFNEWPF